MATRSELQRQLDALSYDDFLQLVAAFETAFEREPVRFGRYVMPPAADALAKENRNFCTREILGAADKHEVVHIWLCRYFKIETPREATLNAAVKAADAAQRSANAAEASARHARMSKWAAWTSAMVAGLALLLTLGRSALIDAWAWWESLVRERSQLDGTSLGASDIVRS